MPATEVILVVDDEPTVLHVCARILSREGWKVLRAADAEAAMEHCAGTQINELSLALVDYVMPRVNGLELAKTLRQSRPDIPIIIMSGYMEELEPLTTAISGYYFLPKPIMAEKLVAVVRHILQQRQSEGTESASGVPF